MDTAEAIEFLKSKRVPIDADSSDILGDFVHEIKTSEADEINRQLHEEQLGFILRGFDKEKAEVILNRVVKEYNLYYGDDEFDEEEEETSEETGSPFADEESEEAAAAE